MLLFTPDTAAIPPFLYYVLSESLLHLLLCLIFRQMHPNFINVRLKNPGTSDKKSSHKIKYKKIPRVHYSITNMGCPNSTICSFSTRISLTVPSNSDSISFISFIASTIPRTCPILTLSPTFTNGALSGEEAA